jgi:hypothetical protein
MGSIPLPVLEEKGAFYFAYKHKNVHKKDGHGTRVAQNKKDIHIYLRAARNQSLARRETRKFLSVCLRVLLVYVFRTTRTRRLYRPFWFGDKYALNFGILLRVGR